MGDVVREVIEAYRSGKLVVERDAPKIAEAVSSVRRRLDDPVLCSKATPATLEPGDAVAFVYDNPDVNEPFRFAVIEKFQAGCWVAFTFNIKRRRDPRKDKIVKDGPGFRQYDLGKMLNVRRVCRPAASHMEPAVAEDLAKLGEGVKELMNQLFPNARNEEA